LDQGLPRRKGNFMGHYFLDFHSRSWAMLVDMKEAP
jgi:hypothetical protein